MGNYAKKHIEALKNIFDINGDDYGDFFNVYYDVDDDPELKMFVETKAQEIFTTAQNLLGKKGKLPKEDNETIDKLLKEIISRKDESIKVKRQEELSRSIEETSTKRLQELLSLSEQLISENGYTNSATTSKSVGTDKESREHISVLIAYTTLAKQAILGYSPTEFEANQITKLGLDSESKKNKRFISDKLKSAYDNVRDLGKTSSQKKFLNRAGNNKRNFASSFLMTLAATFGLTLLAQGGMLPVIGASAEAFGIFLASTALPTLLVGTVLGIGASAVKHFVHHRYSKELNSKLNNISDAKLAQIFKKVREIEKTPINKSTKKSLISHLISAKNDRLSALEKWAKNELGIDNLLGNGQIEKRATYQFLVDAARQKLTKSEKKVEKLMNDNRVYDMQKLFTKNKRSMTELVATLGEDNPASKILTGTGEVKQSRIPTKAKKKVDESKTETQQTSEIQTQQNQDLIPESVQETSPSEKETNENSHIPDLQYQAMKKMITDKKSQVQTFKYALEHANLECTIKLTKIKTKYFQISNTKILEELKNALIEMIKVGSPRKSITTKNIRADIDVKAKSKQ